MRKHTLRAYFKTFITPRIFFIACVSMGISVALTAALLQRVALSSSPMWSAIGAVIALALTGTLFPALRRIVDEFIVCDATLRRLVLALMVSGAVSVALFVSGSPPTTLTWRASDGPQMDEIAPVFFGTSWDSIERRVIELHATGDPTKPSPYGAWRAVAELSDVNPGAALELWVTQPSSAVIDPATNAPPPNSDGVDVIVRVEQGEMARSEQRISLDPPFAPEQRSWRRVVVDLPPGAERLAVEVAMRQTLDNDRVWITEVSVTPAGRSLRDRVAITLIVALAGSTLIFIGRIPTIARLTIRLSLFLSGYGWLLIGVACLWLAYLLVWKRGLYLDDYSLKSLAIDLITGERKPIFDFKSNPNFPARLLTWIVLPQIAALVPDHEIAARILMALFTGINALLLGRLIYEMLDSRMAGLVSGGLFLVHPHNEVPFWIGTGGYLLATMLILVSLIAMWRSLGSSKNPFFWIMTSATALLLSYAFSENGVSILILPPMFMLVAMIRQSQTIWCLSRRTIGILTVFLVTNLIYLIVIANNSAVIQNRAGLDLNLSRVFERITGYTKAIAWLAITFGGPTYREAFLLGIMEISDSPCAMLILGGITGLLVLGILTWTDKPNTGRRWTMLAAVVVLTGAVWTVSSLFFPYALATRQVYERRFFYPATAGMATLLAGAAVLLASNIRLLFLGRTIVAGTALALVLASICTLGFARTYAERSRLNELQMEALLRSAPPEMLPSNTFVVPYQSDERLFGRDSALSLYAFGAMEAPWSAFHSLQMTYKRGDLVPLVTNRWGPMRFAVDFTESSHPALQIQNKPVPIDRLLVYQYRDGKAYLITRLTLRLSTGEEYKFDLPLARRLVEMGSPGIFDLVIDI